MARVAAICAIAAFFAYALIPWHWWIENRVSLSAALASPSAAYWFGADNLGRDLFVRLSEAIRWSVLPLWGVVLAFSGIGLLAGVVASLSQSPAGVSTRLLLRSGALVLGAVPVGIAAFVWAVMSERAGLGPVALSVGALFAVRSFLQVLDLVEQDQRLGYWQAHHALGGSRLRCLLRYGFNGQWRRPLLSSLTFHLQVAVAIEASISYLGFGVAEPVASFGNILASHFDLFLKGHWAILLPVLGVFAATSACPTLIQYVIFGGGPGLRPLERTASLAWMRRRASAL